MVIGFAGTAHDTQTEKPGKSAMKKKKKKPNKEKPKALKPGKYPFRAKQTNSISRSLLGGSSVVSSCELLGIMLFQLK